MDINWTIIAYLVVLLFGIMIGYSLKSHKRIIELFQFKSKKSAVISQSNMIKLLAWLCTLIAIGTAVYTVSFIARSDIAIAKVIKVVERNKNGGTSSFPIYEYYLPNGRRLEGRATTEDGSTYSVGDEITIRFISKAPHQSRIDKFSHHWGITAFMIVAAIFLYSINLFLRKREL